MAGATKTTKPLGPRATVLVGQVKKKKGSTTSNVNVYSYMAKSTAEFFGFKIENAAKSTPSAKGAGGKAKTPRLLRGSVGSGSIKVPAGKTAKGATSYKRIPIPAGLSLIQIQAFLGKASKNKPTSFVSRDGRTYPVGTGKK